MAQSSDPPCFQLESWTHLLDKAGYDLNELQLGVNSYSLFNCLCTVNHIPDWIAKDPTSKHLRPLVEKFKKDPNINAVRQLCNRAKHFERNKKSPVTEVQSGYGAGRYGVGEYGVGEPTYLVEIGGKMLDVTEVLSAARAKWETLRHPGGLFKSKC
jgi:hypothetical protein